MRTCVGLCRLGAAPVGVCDSEKLTTPLCAPSVHRHSAFPRNTSFFAMQFDFEGRLEADAQGQPARTLTSRTPPFSRPPAPPQVEPPSSMPAAGRKNYRMARAPPAVRFCRAHSLAAARRLSAATGSAASA